MTDLPISISNTAAKASAGRPSANNDAPSADAQGFGNVLARQVADTAKPAGPKSPSSADDAKQTSAQTGAQDSAEKNPATDGFSSQPADMLAALLAQQNPAVVAQADGNNQPDGVAMPDTVSQPDGLNQLYGNSLLAMNTAINASAPVTPDNQVAGKQMTDKQAMASLAFINGKTNPANTPLAELETVPVPLKGTIEDGNAFSAALKTFDRNELIASSGSQPLRGSAINELSTAAPQSGSLPILAASTPVSSQTSISTPVTQAAWADEFSQKIIWMSTQRNQSAELHLNPPQLGPLDVVLKINGDQATALFTSPHPAVRDAIEQALPKLREMLAESGIMLGNAMVSDQAAKNKQDNSPQKSQGRTSASAAEGVAEVGSIQEARVSTISRHNGMVDTFA
jgi:flagellar hook-length control protein FliK